jgi:hypothetical protein
MAATTKTTTAKTAKATAAPLKAGDVIIVQGKAGTEIKATMGVSFRDAYRLDSSGTPAGKALYTLWNSVLLFLGALTPERKPFRSGDAIKWFATASVMRQHTKNGNIEVVPGKAGFVRLTATGLNYFNGRFAGAIKGQEVSREEAEMLSAAFASGKLSGDTTYFKKDARFRKIQVIA